MDPTNQEDVNELFEYLEEIEKTMRDRNENI